MRNHLGPDPVVHRPSGNVDVVLIAEEYLLLSLDDETGKPLVSSSQVSPGLGGAVITELALLERIGVTPASDGWRGRGRITVTSLKPTDDPVLDDALAAIAECEGRKFSDLVNEVSGRRITKSLRDRLLERLAEQGVLTPETAKLFGLIPRTTWHLAEPGIEDEIRQRLQSALIAGLTPNERTVTLIALLEATGVLNKVVETEDRSAMRKRAKALTEGDWAAKAVKDAIAEAAAVMSVTVGAAT